METLIWSVRISADLDEDDSTHARFTNPRNSVGRNTTVSLLRMSKGICERTPTAEEEFNQQPVHDEDEMRWHSLKELRI